MKYHIHCAKIEDACLFYVWYLLVLRSERLRIKFVKFSISWEGLFFEADYRRAL
jgi:hypothetical protein